MFRLIFIDTDREEIERKDYPALPSTGDVVVLGKGDKWEVTRVFHAFKFVAKEPGSDESVWLAEVECELY